MVVITWFFPISYNIMIYKNILYFLLYCVFFYINMYNYKLYVCIVTFLCKKWIKKLYKIFLIYFVALYPLCTCIYPPNEEFSYIVGRYGLFCINRRLREFCMCILNCHYTKINVHTFIHTCVCVCVWKTIYKLKYWPWFHPESHWSSLYVNLSHSFVESIKGNYILKNRKHGPWDCSNNKKIKIKNNLVRP